MTGSDVIASHQHPRREALVEELHARPFQPMVAPAYVLRLAFMPTADAAARDPQKDRSHLIALLDRHGAVHPGPHARQHSADLGPCRMKWECHTEFVTYLFYAEGEGAAEAVREIALAPTWLDEAPGPIVSASSVDLIAQPEADPGVALGAARVARFDPESFAASLILDGNAVVMGDFRIGADGISHFAIVVTGQTGPRRLGRAVQRLLELEGYCTIALLGLPVARDAMAQLNKIQTGLTRLMDRATAQETSSDRALFDDLTRLSADVETLAAASAFRLNAAHAYASIVEDRIEVLREQPLGGRQQFGEFMTRRFGPAIRTIRATRDRLDAISARASRLAQLLRTRVSVQLEAQNQKVLDQMNRRAEMQLRLQETVEGLSVVAISYYAVSLAAYLLAPLAKAVGIDKPWLMAAVTVPVILGVWWFVRRIRARVTRR